MTLDRGSMNTSSRLCIQQLSIRPRQCVMFLAAHSHFAQRHLETRMQDLRNSRQDDVARRIADSKAPLQCQGSILPSLFLGISEAALT